MRLRISVRGRAVDPVSHSDMLADLRQPRQTCEHSDEQDDGSRFGNHSGRCDKGNLIQAVAAKAISGTVELKVQGQLFAEVLTQDICDIQFLTGPTLAECRCSEDIHIANILGIGICKKDGIGSR